VISEASTEVRMLGKIGYELYHAALNSACMATSTIGANAKRRWERMEANVPGDLVIELSTSGWWLHCDDPHPGPYRYLKVENAIGFLERITQEPYPHDEPWDEAVEGRPEPLEKCYYIRKLHDGEIFRWTNASFATILPVEGWPKIPLGSRVLDDASRRCQRNTTP
jgi:hypothetical protein